MKRKKLSRPRVPLAVPSGPNERWSMDFVSDQLANGRRIRVLNVVDDYSREAILQLPEFSISRLRVTRELERLLEERGAPRTLVCDNGPEFTSKAMFFWARKRRIRIHFIQPGKPTQNAFVESFNGATATAKCATAKRLRNGHPLSRLRNGHDCEMDDCEMDTHPVGNNLHECEQIYRFQGTHA